MANAALQIINIYCYLLDCHLKKKRNKQFGALELFLQCIS